MDAPFHRLPLAGTLLLVAMAGGARADATDDFEAPPARPAAEVLAGAQRLGEHHRVLDPVTSDGLRNHFVLATRFGEFAADGPTMLAVRIREADALDALEHTSAAAVVAGGAGRGVKSQVDTVVGVASHPIGTVAGLPKGIAHLFAGLAAQGGEVVAAGRHAGAQAPGGGAGSAERAAAAASRYARRYVGLSAAQRRWYRKLGVDPYTDNAVLRDAIARSARLDAAAGFGLQFVGVPQVPGAATLGRTLDAIYSEDPAVLRARTRRVLAGYGLDARELDRWQDATVLSPTRQLLLLAAAERLPGVDGRGELFRHALGLLSEPEAQAYVESVELLVLAHQQRPLAAVLGGVRLPAARRADGSLVVCGAFDQVYWTREVADGERQLREALPAPDGSHELWLSGASSARAHQELVARGWAVRELGGPAPGPVAAP